VSMRSTVLEQPQSAAAATVAIPAPRLNPVARSRRNMPLVRSLWHVPPAAWVILDGLLVALGTILSYRVLVFGNPAFGWVVGPWFSGFAFGLCYLVAGMIFGLYEQTTLHARSRIITRTLLTLSLGTALAYAVIYVAFYSVSSRWVGFGIILTHLLAATPVRLGVHHLIASSRLNVICVGTAASVRKVVALLRHGDHRHYHVMGHVLVDHPDSAHPGATQFVPLPEPGSDHHFEHHCPCLGTLDQIANLIRRHSVDQVIVEPELASDSRVTDAILASLEAGCRVTDQPTFVEKLHGEVPADAISTQWLLMADVSTAGGYDAGKRVVDIVAASVGLLLTLPFWPLIVALIRWDSPGAALYSQQRVGRHGRLFTIYKFRTMRNDAEAGGAKWAAVGDSRVTRLGRFLRKSRIDEIPQFWNVLRGDMSLVGPRPERPEFVADLSKRIPHYRQRHLLQPGLTGWAQINYRYGASVEDAHRKLCYDLYYLKNRSFELDTAIMIRTIGTLCLGAR
jgi:exopolysaccharide biosynthesis polyprenyl glycosylphosphotransferase